MDICQGNTAGLGISYYKSGSPASVSCMLLYCYQCEASQGNTLIKDLGEDTSLLSYFSQMTSLFFSHRQSFKQLNHWTEIAEDTQLLPKRNVRGATVVIICVNACFMNLYYVLSFGFFFLSFEWARIGHQSNREKTGSTF